MEQFIISVIKLREAQKNYQLEPNKFTLQEKIFWEMDVDSHLKGLIKTIAKSDIMQKQLHSIFK